MPSEYTEELLKGILKQYQSSFTNKSHREENDDQDLLMDVFGITPGLKRENRQYWGRELGMCWQRLVTEIFRSNCSDYQPALKIDGDEPCDCIVGTDAIDTKYRIGSGDSGTLKKFRQYGRLLSEKGFRPLLLIVREDNLRAALTACHAGGWEVLQGQKSFLFVRKKSGFDLQEALHKFTTTREFSITQ